MIDFTPELHEAALKIYRQYQTGPLYTPPIPEVEGGKLGTILVPGNNGGGNWPGASTDPETGMFYVQSQSWPLAHLITKPRDPSRTDLAFHDKTTLPAGPEGLPLLKGPYKQLTAIDMNKGEIAWQKPIGRGPADHPAIKHLNLDDMGNRGAPWVWAEGGVLVTKTLLIMPQVDVDEANNLQPNGSWLFAFDEATGKELGKVKFDTHLHSSPMTAMHKGRQYIAASKLKCNTELFRHWD